MDVMNDGMRGSIGRLAGTAGAAAWIALLCTAPAFAEGSPEPMNRVSFQVETSREVVNDRVQAVIGVTDEDADSAILADRINTKMSRALAVAKAATGVRVQSGGYSTHPIHQDGKLRRWRASQDLVLESTDIDAITSLVGKLQAELQLRSIGFSISPERRRSVEDELIAEALAAFKERAEIVRKSLGARSYELVQVSINNSSGGPPQPYRMEMDSMMKTTSQVAPALEAGNSQISVYVTGTIELD
jgi:predicted secreted protein